jgi:hypothetical protein
MMLMISKLGIVVVVQVAVTVKQKQLVVVQKTDEIFENIPKFHDLTLQFVKKIPNHVQNSMPTEQHPRRQLIAEQEK